MRISELIGSRVLSLAGAKICGVVCGVRLSSDLKRVKAAEVFPESDDGCDRRFLDIRRVRSVGADTVTIVSESALTDSAPAFSPSPVNLPAFSETGEPLGRITDIVTDGWTVTALCTPEETFSLRDVLSRSGELIVFRAPGSHTHLPRARKTPQPKSTVTEIPAAAPEPVYPGRYAYLLGKRPAEKVTDTSGARIAEAGDVVTAGVIAEARDRGAIARLTASCLKRVSP